MNVRSVFLVTFLITILSFTNGNCQLNNTSYGTDANPSDNGAHNSAFGENALKNVLYVSGSDGSYNSTFGSASMLNNTTGLNNSAFGASSLKLNTTGSDNVALGRSALEKNETGNSNVGVGGRSLYSLENGSYNVALGGYSGYVITTGNYNTCLGFYAGSQLTTGSKNIFLGNRAGYNTSATLSDKLFITNTEGNFPLIWGDMNSDTRYLKVNLRTSTNGMGTSTENSRFEINGPNNKSGLKFTRLTSSFNPSTNATKFLTVDSAGDVILQNIPIGSGGPDTNIYTHDGPLTANRTMDMADFNLHFNTLNSPTHGKIYIGDTPDYPTATGEYKLYVEGGILTEKVKVALRSTANWADYVFSDDYQLKSLKEVETFIKENKHLPGIESAQELVENGLDLGEMQAKQMGKIEELTLYIIEQDKAIEKQQIAFEKQSKEIEELKALVNLLLDKK